MSGFDIQGPQGLPTPRLLGDREGEIAPARAESGAGFSASLSEALAEVSDLGKETRQKAEALARGEPVEIHELMVAMNKSEIAFNLMLEVRNKIVDAWQRLLRSV